MESLTHLLILPFTQWAVDDAGFMSPHWTNPDGCTCPVEFCTLPIVLTSVLAPSALDLFVRGTQINAGSDFQDFSNLFGGVSRVVSLEFSVSQRVC